MERRLEVNVMDPVHASRGCSIQSNSSHRTAQGYSTHHNIRCMHSRYCGGTDNRNGQLEDRVRQEWPKMVACECGTKDCKRETEEVRNKADLRAQRCSLSVNRGKGQVVVSHHDGIHCIKLFKHEHITTLWLVILGLKDSIFNIPL